MLWDTLHADVFGVGLAVETVGLVVLGTEVVIVTQLQLLAGQLQCNEVLGEHVGLDLRVVLVPARRTVQELLLVVHHLQAQLAHCVAAVQVAGDLRLRVVQLVTHRAFHSRSSRYITLHHTRLWTPQLQASHRFQTDVSCQIAVANISHTRKISVNN